MVGELLSVTTGDAFGIGPSLPGWAESGEVDDTASRMQIRSLKALPFGEEIALRIRLQDFGLGSMGGVYQATESKVDASSS